MRTAWLIALLFPVMVLAQDLAAERELYPLAHKDEQTAAELLKLTADADTAVPTQTAYRGAALMIAAQFASGISGKLKLFNEGKDLMVKVVEAAPESVEVRFLRMTVQENAPGFLLYKGDLQQDKDFILGHFSAEKDAGLKKMIRTHARTSSVYSDEEKAKLLPVR